MDATAPVFAVEEGRTYIVVSYALHRDAAGDPATFSSDFMAMMNGMRSQDPVKAITAEGWLEMRPGSPPVRSSTRASASW